MKKYRNYSQPAQDMVLCGIAPFGANMVIAPGHKPPGYRGTTIDWLKANAPKGFTPRFTSTFDVIHKGGVWRCALWLLTPIRWTV